MLAAKLDPLSSIPSPSSRKRLAGADIPPAKRAKTASSSSVPRTADSTVASHLEARRRKAVGWLGVNDGALSSAPDKIAAQGMHTLLYANQYTESFAGGNPVLTRTKLDTETAETNGSTSKLADQSDRIGPTAPTPALLARINASNDKQDTRQASDDFRSVIDDLTVQNKKLKTKLRKYARLHSAHLQKEKLFEIKVHEGLPAHKKRELEETLRSFAASIDNASSTAPPSGGIKLSAAKRPSALLNASSSSTSDSKMVDSAYASASMSGNHLPRSYSGQNQSSTARDNQIHLYLDDIPETLYPSKNPMLSDRAKSKLVVRRLEQIFTGRGAATHSHTHSQQQQDVSTAAAEHERSKLTAGGLRVWQEGTREAHILPESSDIREDPMEESSGSHELHDNSDGKGPNVSDQVPPDSPEQRPTRPLDLDIHRAQVPSENMEYIRHLGAPGPEMEERLLADGEAGWVYLNLLTSMAQVHTVNVTPEFIRKAIHLYSQKIELSKDGTMIRWLGGTRGSRLSSAGDEADGQWKSSESSVSVSKMGSTEDFSSKDGLSGGQSSPRRSGLQPRSRKPALPKESSADSERFQYRPLFQHKTSSAEDDDSEFGSDSPASTNSMEYDTGINSSSNAISGPPPRVKARKHDNGPIIFYHGAKFCTDLGGDPNLSSSNVAYNRFVEHPVGSIVPVSGDEGDDQSGGPKKTVATGTASSPRSMARSALDLGDLANSISDCTSQSAGINPVDMEASGLGGILPSDNFVVKVQTRHHSITTTSRAQQDRGRKQPHQRLLHRLPIANLSAFRTNPQPAPFIPRTSGSSPSSPPVKAEIISAVRSTLPPSCLPPPSYGLHLASTSESSESEPESEGPQSSLSSASARAARFNPRHMPHHINPSAAYHGFPKGNAPATQHASVTQQTPSIQQRPAAQPLVKLPTPVLRRSQIIHPTPPRLVKHPSTSTEETKESSPSPSDDLESDDDGSIDLLWNARLQDPEAVEKREREMWEWEREQEEGEESVSLAATGGGSEDEDGSADSMSIDRGDVSE